jgi:hypothetical protein
MVGPQAVISLRPSDGGWYVSAAIEGAPDQLPRVFVRAHGTCEEAISEAASWALGWLRRLRKVPDRGSR